MLISKQPSAVVNNRERNQLDLLIAVEHCARKSLIALLHVSIFSRRFME